MSTKQRKAQSTRLCHKRIGIIYQGKHTWAINMQRFLILNAVPNYFSVVATKNDTLLNVKHHNKSLT
jgi:hypothetical protein